MVNPQFLTPMFMKWLIIVLASSIMLTNCAKTHKEPNSSALLEVDRSFSLFSEKNGANAAFLAFCHNEGVLLKPNSYPIVGIESVAQYLQSGSDSSYTLTWEPISAHIAQSGELGYTYGTWLLTSKETEQESRGTYVTIWKQNANGDWRFVLDSGNSGLSKE